MRFVLVNGGTPCRQSFCALCCKPVGASYLQKIDTRLSYCDGKAVPNAPNAPCWAIENHARAS
jgi:hypothetical protein